MVVISNDLEDPMSVKKMSFEEIKNNKDHFLEVYGLKNIFSSSCCSWDDLIEIGEDFEKKRDKEYFDIIQRYIVEISAFENVHSYRYRIKRTDSLLAKIIKKSVQREEKITKDNYFREISDLLGIRILYIFKEDYWSIHKQLMSKYKDQLVENVHLKLRDGDDEKTYEDLMKKYDIKIEKNVTYRSIHYTINSAISNISQSPKLEIQTRTIFEEGWSEINHKLVYKKSNSENAHLEKSSRILSELVGSCDAIGSLMKYLYDEINDKQKNDIGFDSSKETSDSIGETIRRFLMQ